MFFGMGWQELLIIAAVALIVVGPQDLPKMLRQMGGWLGQLQRIGKDVRNSVDDALREADLKDAVDTVKSVRNFTPAGALKLSMTFALLPFGATSAAALPLPSSQGLPCQSKAGSPLDFPSHQGSLSAVRATFVKIVSRMILSYAFLLVASLVPGTTPK